jgi:hypothetical protein
MLSILKRAKYFIQKESFPMNPYALIPTCEVLPTTSTSPLKFPAFVIRIRIEIKSKKFAFQSEI